VDAASETSGTARNEPDGTPVPVCQEGLANTLLDPPPPAHKSPPPATVPLEFQTDSGMKLKADS